MSGALLTPNEVAALADAPRTVVEKALEQKVFGAGRGAGGARRLLPLHAVVLATAVKSLGRRLSVNDKKVVARRLAALPPSALRTAEIEVAPAVILRLGMLAASAIERAERYAADRDAFIETIDGVQGGRPAIKGTRLTVGAIYGRLSSGGTIDTLMDDYPDIPRRAFEAAQLYGRTHPPVGRPVPTRRRM
ncbi:MAG: DUF433 domain-containing protein [Methylorubrum rhodinum]|uniref:DUF433 domain-containing protein n=1 Tax=Methylorubrum rhodinum TaxID=29428 RepID=UPI003BAF696B